MMKQPLLRFHKSKSVRWKLPNEDAECDYHLPPHDSPLKPHQTGLAELFTQPTLQPSASPTSSVSSSSASIKHSLRKSRSVIERWFNGLPGSSNRDELTHSDSVFEKITKSKILGSGDNSQADTTPTTTTMVNDTDEEKCVAEEEKKLVVLDLQKSELEEEEATINIPVTSGSEGTESTGFSFAGNSLKDFKVKAIEKQVKFNTPSPDPDSKDKPGKGLLKKKSFQDLLSMTTKKQQRC